MKAIVVRTTGEAAAVMHLETLPDPAPGAREVIVAVEACGVCFHDIVSRNGTMKVGIELPIVLGHEAAGTVVAVGREVSRIRPGMRVAALERSHVCAQCRYCRTGREPLCAEQIFLGDKGLNGGYAEFVALEEDAIVPVPDGVSIEAAAIAACAIGTVHHALCAVGRVQLGESVLVTGSGGGVGSHAVQIARRAGAFVIAQTTSPQKADAIKALGADLVVVSERGKDFSDAVRAATGGEGVDIVVDNVGTALFTPTRRSLARGGRWVLVGQLTGEFVPFNPAQLFLKSINMLSAMSTTRLELEQCLALLQRGEVKPVIDCTFPLAEAAAAHAHVESGRAFGRVILRPGA